jgi:hypothetical protein
MKKHDIEGGTSIGFFLLKNEGIAFHIASRDRE